MDFLMKSCALFVLLCVSLQGALGLQCFVCSSAGGNTSCADPLDKAKLQPLDCDTWCHSRGAFIPAQAAEAGRIFPLVPCPPVGNFSVCRKVKQSTTTAGENEGKAVDIIVRACGYIDDTKDYNYRTSANSKSELFECNTDGCNSGHTVFASLSLVVMTGLVTFFRV